MNILKLFKRPKAFPEKAPNTSERIEVILSGSGGQGMILGGIILAEAATLYDEKEAVMAQSYGPEARGGASRAEIIISSGEIDYPKVMHPDILLAMTQEAMDKYENLIDANGLLIVDETLVKKYPSHFKYVFKAPFSLLAIKLLSAPIVANVIALGSLVSITHVVSKEALIRSVLAHVSQKFLVVDRVAIDTGFKVVEDSGFHWERQVV